MPKYTLDKIKYATDSPTFQKAISLYEGGRVTQFEENFANYSAVVLGTKPYRVVVDARNYDRGQCECYLGQNDTLCKHMVAVAIFAVKSGKNLTKEEKQLIEQPTCSGALGTLSKGELSKIKKSISEAMRFIRDYRGPSRTWFAYQNSLSEGCNRLSKIASDLPISKQTAKLLVDLLLKLDNKICRGGVDDSDGTVGGFIQEMTIVLKEYVKLDSECIKTFSALLNVETCFGWEQSLVELL